MINLGMVRPGSTIYVPFESFASSTGAPITMSNFAVGDIKIYKDGGTTERASTSGFTLLDTDGIDFDSITGIHGFSVDLSDNTTADFYAAGSKYFIVISTITVDSQTMSFVVAFFRIGLEEAIVNTTIATLSTQTSFTLTTGPAEDDALNGMWAIIHDAASAVQFSLVQIDDYTGSTKTVTLAAGGTFTVAAKDNISIMGPMPLQPTTVGRKLDVSTGGEAGLDWANIGSPTTAQTLSGTSTKALEPTTAGRTLDVAATGEAGLDWSNMTGQATAQALTNTTILTVTGNVNGSVASVTNGVTVATGGIIAASFGAGAINAAAIAADAITAAKIADGAIDAATFASGAINAASIAADAITSAKIADGAIDAATFAAGAIDAAAMATDAITSAELATTAVAEIAGAVWDIVLASHLTSGTTGAALNAAGSAGDPWSTALPGAYGAGTAGKIIGDNINATISSRLAPTTAGRTLDVTATGGAGIDWSNVENPTSTVGLTGTTISSGQVVASVTGAVGSVTGNVGGNVVGSVASVTGNVGGNVVGSVASVTGNVGGNVTGSVGSVATGGITAASFAAGAIDAAAIAADAIGSSELAATAVTEIAGAVWDVVLASHLTAGSTGAALDAAQTGGTVTIDSTAANLVADHVWRRNYDNIRASSDGDTIDGRSGLGLMAKLVNKIDLVSVPGFLLMFHEDDSTEFWRQTATSDGTAEPVVTLDTV